MEDQPVLGRDNRYRMETVMETGRVVAQEIYVERLREPVDGRQVLVTMEAPGVKVSIPLNGEEMETLMAGMTRMRNRDLTQISR